MSTRQISTNSFRHQSVDRLAPGLATVAKSPDGVVEAYRVRSVTRFAAAVQWHPEWNVMSNEFSKALFAAFGASARERAHEHR